jgi:copper(I)-binding protein
MKTVSGWLLLASVFMTMYVSAAELKIHDDWVAAAPPVAKSQAAYICFINDSDKDVKITGVSAKGYGTAALHQSMQEGDMVMMHAMSSLVVPAHKMVTLEPGGMHIMLMAPEKIAMPGEKIKLTVEYDDNTRQVFELEVKTPVAKPVEQTHGNMHKEH